MFWNIFLHYLDRDFFNKVERGRINHFDGFRINISNDNFSQHWSLLADDFGQLSSINALDSRNALLGKPKEKLNLTKMNYHIKKILPNLVWFNPWANDPAELSQKIFISKVVKSGPKIFSNFQMIGQLPQ